MNRVAVIVLLALCAAGPAAAQDYGTWRSQCAETRLAGTVRAAGPRARVMSFDVIVNARGEGATAHLSLRLSEGNLRYAQMRIDDDKTTNDFACVERDCVMGAEQSCTAMQKFHSAETAAMRLTTGRGGRLIIRIKLAGFGDALAAARAGM